MKARLLPIDPTGLWATIRTRVRDRLDGVSVDQLDAALRGLAVGIVLVLSLVGYRYPPPSVAFPPFPVAPSLVAFVLVLYNFGVIVLLGVPWRRPPGFVLYLLDWLVVTAAIVLTGGFYSPFLVLYYALVIGAALRLDIQRTLVLVGACSLVYAAVSRSDTPPADGAGLHLPWLVVGITSLLMAAMTAMVMKRAVDVDKARLHLEQQTAQRLGLLNELTRAVLHSSPDSAGLLHTVAAIAPNALQADCALAVLLDPAGAPQHVAVDAGAPPALTPGVEALVRDAIAQRAPILLDDVPQDPRGADLRAGLGRVQTALCVPLFADDEPAGALIVGSYSPRCFTPDEIGLLAAIGHQTGLSVRLARLYDLERDKAALSAERERVERDLLNTVSHELRTPLTAIKTGVSGLLAGVAARPPAEARLLQNIDRSTERLILLVNDLVDMGRLRAGRITLAREQLDLREVIRDAVTTVRPLTDARRQVLRVELPDAVPSVPGDRRRLEQVLLNILYNANKYTPPGGHIAVGLTVAPAQVRVWVRDTGPGIAPAEQARIFERFYVAGNGATQRTDAVGLGLAIARSLIELHGGRIGVRSRPGAGSTFYFTLPREPADADPDADA